MAEGHIVLRTVRHGRVKIGGEWWRPDQKWMEYDGRLDGKRLAFGRYREPDGSRKHLCLWGSEHMYRCTAGQPGEWTGCDHPDCWPGPGCVDGKFVWEWWRLESELEPVPPTEGEQ